MVGAVDAAAERKRLTKQLDGHRQATRRDGRQIGERELCQPGRAHRRAARTRQAAAVARAAGEGAGAAESVAVGIEPPGPAVAGRAQRSRATCQTGRGNRRWACGVADRAAETGRGCGTDRVTLRRSPPARTCARRGQEQPRSPTSAGRPAAVLCGPARMRRGCGPASLRATIVRLRCSGR